MKRKKLLKNQLLSVFIFGIILSGLYIASTTFKYSTPFYPKASEIPLLIKTDTPQPSPTASASAIIIKPVPLSTKSSEVKIPVKLPKDSYSIALIGDSMVETMGENTDYLQKSLASRYPSTQFKLYNYGIGGQNVEQGLSRFPSPFNYKTRNFPPLSEIHPDILIVGSFSYNPFAEHDRTKHSRLLREMVNQARGVSGRVYLLAEIAPLKEGFGQGVGGINWPEDKAATQAIHIIEQLDDSVTVAKTENVPLINAYQSSKVNGNYGNKIYVATHDGIHPSIEGHVFMANLIASLLSF